MIQNIWIIWLTFLVDQSGLIRKLTYLDVTQILTDHKLFRKIHWYLIIKQVNIETRLGSGECTEPPLV